MVSNTLIFTGLPGGDRYGSACDIVRDLVEQTHTIPVYWTLLKSFRRILAVFSTAEDAVKVKTCLDAAMISYQRFEDSSQLRLFYGQNTPIEPDSNNTLQLPDSGRLWLLSPPPSPPINWKARTEFEPNRQTHFLPDEFEIAFENNMKRNEPSWTPVVKGKPSPKSTILLESVPLTIDTKLDKESGIASPLSTPSIILEAEDDEIIYDGSSTSSSLPRTEMPPL